MKKFAKKIVLLGDSAVGKTSLIRKFVEDVFDDSYISTIGTKVTKKEVRLMLEGQEALMNLMIWDMLGREGYISTQARQMVGAQGVILVGDVTRPETLRSMEKYWIPLLFRTIGSVNLPMVFLGNKADLVSEAGEAERILMRLGKGYNYGMKEVLPAELNTWFMTSAKTGENVENAFLTMVHMAFHSNRAQDPFYDRIRSLVIERLRDENPKETLIQVCDLIIYEFGEMYGSSAEAGQVLREEVARAGVDHNEPTREALRELVDYLIEAAGEVVQDQALLDSKRKEWLAYIEGA
ncbi:MAG: Rab family GTPase [Candidatus Thermoplasmatota archaeon]